MKIKILLFVFVVLFSIGCVSGVEFWVSDWYIAAPFDDDVRYTADYFEYGGNSYIIGGLYDGTYKGYVIDNDLWITNASITTGLVDVGIRSSPAVFYKDETLYLISGSSSSLFGYTWNGTYWVPDSDILNGTSGVLNSHIQIFQHENVLRMICFSDSSKTFSGYTWNGTYWVPDNTISNGLPILNGLARIDGGGFTLYEKDDITYMIISGEYDTTHDLSFTWGFFFDGTGWYISNNIVAGIQQGVLFSTHTPLVYETQSGVFNLIMLDSRPYGYFLFDSAADYAIGTFEINGIVHNAINGLNIDNSSVVITQSGFGFSDTTDENGAYNTTGFTAGYEMTFNVTKTNYTHEEWSWTAWEGKTYTINQYMVPTNVTFNGSGAIHGVITYDPYHQALENATVTIANATWSNTTQSSAYGYYFFENLTVSDYNISAASSGYSTSGNVTVSVNGTTLQNVNLQPKLTLTVVTKNADNLNLITDYSIILEGVTYNSVNGSLQIGNLEDGVKDLILTAEGYYATEKVIYMDSDTTSTILATQVLGSGTQYAPHYVKFTLKSLLGALYPNVDVVVYLGDAASGTLTLNGTTGTDSAVGFMLVENIQYTITFIDSTQGIDETITLYPKDDDYTVYTGIGNLIDDLLNPDDEEQEITAIDVSISKTIINDNTANITVNYNDIMDETSGLTLTLSQSIDGNITNNTILATASLGTLNNTAYNFTVTNYNGESYFIAITATHTTHGSISRLYGVQFENTATQFGFAGEVVGWLAIIFLMWFSLTATQATVPHTAIGVCALATVLMALGWGQYLSTAGLALAWIMSLAANFAVGKEASS